MPLSSQPQQNKSEIVFIGGPTAVGKSAVAVELAQRFGGEIISCDAMQVYRDVSIANNKPSLEMMKKVKHHLIDIVSVRDHFDVMQFEQLARKTILEVMSQGKIPIVTGGTGMYMQVLLDGIFDGPKENIFLREQLTEEAKKKGTEALYKKLVKLDPPAAGKIHPNDLKRVIRALEVVMVTGKPISQLQQEREGLWGKYPIKVFIINRDRKELYETIDARVDEMFEQGLLDEVKALAKLKLSKTAGAMIGIKEISAYLKKEILLDKATELMKKNTRNYAKRQLTWFRKDQRFEWIEINRNNTIETILPQLSERLSWSTR